SPPAWVGSVRLLRTSRDHPSPPTPGGLGARMGRTSNLSHANLLPHPDELRAHVRMEDCARQRQRLWLGPSRRQVREEQKACSGKHGCCAMLCGVSGGVGSSCPQLGAECRILRGLSGDVPGRGIQMHSSPYLAERLDAAGDTGALAARKRLTDPNTN